MANQYTKLFIDNQEIDLKKSEELPLNITKRVNNIEGEIQGDYSRASITVPATKNNVSVLGDSRRFFDFRIEADGMPDFNGTAQVRKGKSYSQSYGAIKENYELNLVSNNTSWFVLLGETFLSDLTTDVVDFIATSVLSGFLESSHIVNNWAFCLIKYKEWANLGIAGTGIHYAPSVFESTPALYFKPLVIAAFNSIGYTVQSDFFDTDLFSKLVISTPLPEKMTKGFNDEYLNTQVSLSAPILHGLVSITPYPFDTIDIAAIQNPTAYSLGTNLYTAPLDGFYEVSCDFTFGNVPPAAPYFFFIQLYKNGAAVTPANPIGFAFDDTGASAPYPTAGVHLTATSVIKMNAGDTTSYRFATAGGITVNTAICNFKGEATISIGMPIDFKYLLRDWKFLDFFKGIICAFNLTIETDNDSRVVVIEPKDQYKNTKRFGALSEIKQGFHQSTTKDYTELVDYKKKGGFEFVKMKGRFDYKWDADDEETIKWIEQTNNFKVYESRFPMSNGADNSSTEPKTVPFFKKSIHVIDVQTRFPDTNAYPQFPLIYPQSYIEDPTATENKEEWGPRMFYHAGQRFGLEEEDGSIELFEFPGIEQRLPLTFMVNYGDNTGLDPNLGFDTQVINGAISTGLTQRFYLQELARNDKGQLRKNYIKFNSIDNANFSFRIKGIIDSQRYVIQEIQGFNSLKDAPTNFFFYLDIYPSADDVANIQNSPLLGVVSLLGT